MFCATALFTWKLDATDVSCMAGHANVRTTLDMYIGTTAGVLDRARTANERTETCPHIAARPSSGSPDGAGIVRRRPEIRGITYSEHYQDGNPCSVATAS